MFVVMAPTLLEVPPPIQHGMPHGRSAKVKASQPKSRSSTIVQASHPDQRKSNQVFVVNKSKEEELIKEQVKDGSKGVKRPKPKQEGPLATS